MMRPTRRTQPYRTSGSRAPSQVLNTMRAGRAAAGNPLMAAFAQSQKAKSKRPLIPRTTPYHKRKRP